MKPIHIDDREERVECTIYEIPDIQKSLDWEVPTRGFKIIEKPYNIVSGEKVYIKVYIKEETFLCMATLPVEKADANLVRQIVHAKWGIEKQCHQRLKRQLVYDPQFPPPSKCHLCFAADTVYDL